MRLAAATIYIPNLDGAERVLRALASVSGQSPAHRVVVVDNASTDGSPERIARAYPEATVLRLPHNHGFGQALNLGVAAHPARQLIFLNNDVCCEPRFLEALLEQAGGCSVAGVLLQHERPHLIDSAGVVADRTLLGFDYLHGEPADRARDARPPLGATGGAALIPLDAFQRVGGFDERMFAYFEDVDLAVRMHQIGVGCRLAADARAVHEHAATLGAGSSAKNALTGFSRGYMLRRYGVMRHPRRALRVLAGELVVCAGQLAVDRTVSGAAGRVRGWRAGARLPVRPMPAEGLVDLPFVAAVRLRAGRSRTARGMGR